MNLTNKTPWQTKSTHKMDSPYAKELQVAIRTVQCAATLSAHILAQAQAQAQAQQDGLDSGMGVVSKDDLSPVTIADFAIQALLTCTIHHAFPNDKFVGEESADALRANPALLARVWAALQTLQAQTEAELGVEADTAVVRFPETPDQMCAMIDWCGTGHPGRGGRIWVFDPIDGTENFVKGLVYAINVALLTDGRQTLSVVGCPNMSADVAYPAGDASLDATGEGCIALAVRGHGTWVRKLRGPPNAGCAPGSGGCGAAAAAADVGLRKLIQHIDAPSGMRATSNLRSTSARNSSGLGAVHGEVARRLGVEWPGSNLLPWVIRWVLLAFGVGNATWWVYKERSRLAKIWDHAGAMLLFEEVGGKVTDVDGQDIDLTANRKMTANYGIVAAPENLHDQVLATVQQVVREQKPELLTKQA